ncbi:MAG: lysophospholipid acyltransferase family protein [Pirellulaceae bacterium]|nr:lysophospholipid acyltransferase family protein [Pirellulaceae bacterium]
MRTKQMVLDYLVYVVVRVLICIAQAMRIETGQAAARFLGWFFHEVLRLRRDVIEENLLHAFPEWSDDQRRRLARRMWEHLFLLVIEVAHASRKIHETNWRDYISLRNHEKLVRMLLQDDRPTLIVTAHFGNFEVAGYVLGLLGFPTYTVARTLDNPYLDRFLNDFRGRTGQYMIPKNGGYDQIVDVLGQGKTMTMLADQYAGQKGCWVEFFGREASAHKAIALFALDNDCPVIVSSARRVDDRPLHVELAITAVADSRELRDELGTIGDVTQWYTSRLEEMIRRSPEQYWWIHRRWKERRRHRRRKKAA